MYKTKLGISVGLMGAIVCFLGAFLGLQWYFLAIIAYILLKEENEWLRRLALKVVIILISVTFITWVIRLAFDTAIIDFINIFKDDMEMSEVLWPGKIADYTTKYISYFADVLLILAGFKAIKQGHFSVKPVDELISKNV